jgi:hypothetical protein
MQISQKVSQSSSQLPIYVRNLPKDLSTNHDITCIIYTRNPESQDISTIARCFLPRAEINFSNKSFTWENTHIKCLELLCTITDLWVSSPFNYSMWIYNITQWFAHLTTFLIQYKSMSNNTGVWSLSCRKRSNRMNSFSRQKFMFKWAFYWVRDISFSVEVLGAYDIKWMKRTWWHTCLPT